MSSVIDDVSINYGLLTFDNIGKALLSVFQILTNDNWAQTMYNLMNVDNPAIATLYLCSMVIIGSFFLMNLILAVILDSFISVQEDDIKEKFKAENMSDLQKVHDVKKNILD